MSSHLLEQDKKHRAHALHPNESFIVQAPAGSGKTELLIQRYLTLLTFAQKPEDILAITFTKKAANEMRTRVINALLASLYEREPTSSHQQLTWQLGKKVLARDAEYHWNIINNPNQLRIQTIDSLCTFITKQLPLLSHFGSPPDLTTTAETLYSEAVQEVLAHIEEDVAWSDAIATLLKHLDNNLTKLHDLCVNLLAKRDQWLPYIHLSSQQTEIKQALENQLSWVIAASLDKLIDVFPSALSAELIALAQFAADQLDKTNPESAITLCKDLRSLPSNHPHDKATWLGLATLLLTDANTWRKKIDSSIGFPAASNFKNKDEKAQFTQLKERMKTLLAQLENHEAFRVALGNVKDLPDARYSKEQWEILQALLFVLKIMVAQLRLVFQKHGQIDFIENAQAALAALGQAESPTDLALAFDYQIKHILIDEFQDTSFTQYQLLEKLTFGWEPHDGRTLFIVGDPMQSIYRFREAEVGLFIRMWHNGIGHIHLTPLTLTANFRSTADIVNWNNTHFQTIFPAFNDIATGAVTYSQSTAIQQSHTHSEVMLRGWRNPSTQANDIVHQIKDTLSQHPQSSIAILVRTRSHLETILPALKAANIAYSALDIDPLATRPVIQDLFALTCALLHPLDRIAWLAILRAPWCGLSLADLLILANSRYAALSEQLLDKTRQQQLSQDGQERVEKLMAVLQTAQAERGRYRLRLWVENTWALLGGPACLQNETAMEDAKAYFHLLETLEKIDITQLKEKITQLFASSTHTNTNVQIMTIHNAKGLEFDTVILPHLERKPKRDDKQLLMWLEQPLLSDQTALLLAPIQAIGKEEDRLYKYIRLQQKAKLMYETDRLFYVAATRAKARLYLHFVCEDDEPNKLQGSFLEKLWPFYMNKKSEILSSLTQPLENKLPTERYLTRLTSAWQNPIKHPPLARPPKHQKAPGFQLLHQKHKQIGILTHRLLQQLSLRGESWWTANDTATKSAYLHSQLAQLGMPIHEIKEAASLISNIITNTLQDERGQWILRSQQAAKTEYAISAQLNGKTENLIIDKTFIDDNGTRWIIDYKTTALSQTDVDYFLQKEVDKYQEKMQTYASALQLLDPRPIKLGLYFPALPTWLVL